MPKTKSPYSRCCGASLEITETERGSILLCAHCQNSNTKAVIDDRPFLAGDIVDLIFPHMPPINETVVRCTPSESYEWQVTLKDGTVIGHSLLRLKKGNSEIRDE